MHRTLIAAAAPLVLLAGCGQEQAPAPADPDAIFSTVAEVEAGQLAAIRTRDLAGAIAVYAPEATLITPGAPAATTPEQIRAAFEEQFRDPEMKVSLSPVRHWVSAAGDLAVTQSSLEMTMTDPQTGRVVTSPGANQTVWKKDAAGAWKMVSDYNVALPRGE